MRSCYSSFECANPHLPSFLQVLLPTTFIKSVTQNILKFYISQESRVNNQPINFNGRVTSKENNSMSAHPLDWWVEWLICVFLITSIFVEVAAELSFLLTGRSHATAIKVSVIRLEASLTTRFVPIVWLLLLLFRMESSKSVEACFLLA